MFSNFKHHCQCMQIHQLGDDEDVLLNVLSIVWLQAQRRQIAKLIFKLISCFSVGTDVVSEVLKNLTMV